RRFAHGTNDWPFRRRGARGDPHGRGDLSCAPLSRHADDRDARHHDYRNAGVRVGGEEQPVQSRCDDRRSRCTPRAIRPARHDWPLAPNYRAAGLKLVDEARSLRADADRQSSAARATLSDGDPLAALLDDVRGYVAFVFDRAPILEGLSAGFERTEAGLQHAAHLYEGESKYLGAGLWALNEKYRSVLDAPAVAPFTREFSTTSR